MPLRVSMDGLTAVLGKDLTPQMSAGNSARTDETALTTVAPNVVVSTEEQAWGKNAYEVQEGPTVQTTAFDIVYTPRGMAAVKQWFNDRCLADAFSENMFVDVMRHLTDLKDSEILDLFDLFVVATAHRQLLKFWFQHHEAMFVIMAQGAATINPGVIYTLAHVLGLSDEIIHAEFQALAIKELEVVSNEEFVMLIAALFAKLDGGDEDVLDMDDDGFGDFDDDGAALLDEEGGVSLDKTGGKGGSGDPKGQGGGCVCCSIM